MNSDGTGKRQLTDDERYRDEMPLWSSDGSWIVFARLNSKGNASLWVGSSAGGKQRELVESMSLKDTPPWAGSGDAFELNWLQLFSWWQPGH
jgi:Tol biopolymer transport system component